MYVPAEKFLLAIIRIC